MKIRDTKKGFSLVEVIVASTIIGVSMVAMINAFGYFIRAEIGNTKLVKATYLLEEGVEATRYLRDKGWTQNIAPLSTTTSYYLALSTTNGVATWSATTTRQIYDGVFERTIVLASVLRENTTKNISTAVSGTSVDTNTRKLTVTVSWPGISGATSTQTISAYITNLEHN